MVSGALVVLVVALVVAIQGRALPLIEGGEGGDGGVCGDDDATPFSFDSFRSAMVQCTSCACTYGSFIYLRQSLNFSHRL